MKRFLVVLGILALVGGGGYWYYSRNTAPPPGKGKAPAATARVERRDIRFSLDVTGDVSPASQVEIKPEVSGRIIKLRVVAGQEVKKDDLLVELDDRDLRTQRDGVLTDIETARLNVARNEGNFGRGQGLFEANLSSKETFDNLSSDLALSKNALVKSQRSLALIDYQLTKTRILSPTDGTILALPVVEGQVVTAAASVNSGTSLMTIANLANLIVVCQVNQVDVTKIATGQKVSVSMEALHEPPMSAAIRFISPLATVKNNIKGFQVEASIENPSKRLRPGMTVNITVPLESAENAVSVPVNAIFSDRDDSKVVYVQKGEQAEKRKVELGVTNYFFTQILSGVEVGETVLLTEPPKQKG
jgi:RND family efflux transporter MFP subunit